MLSTIKIKKTNKQEILSAGVDMEKSKPCVFVGGNVNWGSHYQYRMEATKN